MNKQEFYRNHAVLMLADIPDNISDHDPELNVRMQTVFDKYFIDYKARFAGKTLIERLEGCSFIDPEIELMQSDCIEEQSNKLTSFDLMTLPPTKRIKVKRYLTFLEAIKAKKLKVSNPIKSFPQLLMNLFDKGEQFTEELRKEFCNEKGLKIRYMIEALKEQSILSDTVSDLSIYKSLSEYFGTGIGTYQSIFDFKFDYENPNFHKKHKDKINKAHGRIRSILEKLFPVK
jgi:hypothetical protein